MADALAVTLHASGAETATGVGALIVDIGMLRTCARLLLQVTVASGTSPNLVVSLDTSTDGATGWRSVGTFTAATGATFERKTFAGLERFVRASWTITGTTPSFTFSVGGEAHVIYAQPSDMPRVAGSSVALSGISADIQADCCLRATAEAETALNSAYELPLTAWGEDLRGHVAARALYHTLNVRGRKPGGTDILIDLAGGYRTEANVKSAAQAFFDDIASGKLKPVGIVDSTPDLFEGAGVVVSGPQLNW